MGLSGSPLRRRAEIIMSLHSLVRTAYDRFLRPDPVEVLKKRGLQVGKNFHMLREVIIDYPHCWLITIGDNVTLAPRVHILAHDASTKIHLGYTRIGKVIIGDRVFIGASAIILPGVRIGSDVVIGAGSVVTRDIPDNVLAIGNPAQALMSLDSYLARKKEEMERLPRFGGEFVDGHISDAMKQQMNQRMADRFGYIV